MRTWMIVFKLQKIWGGVNYESILVSYNDVRYRGMRDTQSGAESA